MSMAKRITIGEVRLCYIHLDEPWAPIQGSKENGKYCVTALIPKSNADLVKSITDALQEAYQEGVSGPWSGKTPPSGYWHNPLQDGDLPKKDGSARGPEFQGHYYMTAKTMSAPEVYGPDKQKASPDIVYPGCFGWVSISLKPYGVGGNMGVSVFLNAVMKTTDGPNLAGGSGASGSSGDFAGVPVSSAVAQQAESPVATPFTAPQQAGPNLSGLGREEIEEMLRQMMANGNNLPS